jgi:hypothetical protein
LKQHPYEWLTGLFSEFSYLLYQILKDEFSFCLCTDIFWIKIALLQTSKALLDGILYLALCYLS